MSIRRDDLERLTRRKAYLDGKVERGACNDYDRAEQHMTARLINLLENMDNIEYNARNKRRSELDGWISRQGVDEMF